MKRILLLTNVLPWPIRRNGGAQRTALLKRALERHGQVDVFGIGTEALLDPTDPNFDRLCAEHGVIARRLIDVQTPKAPFYLPGPLGNIWSTIGRYDSYYAPFPAIAEELARVVEKSRYDLIVSRYIQPALQGDSLRFANIPKLIDFDDIDWSTLGNAMRAKPWPGIGGKIASAQILKRVQRACESALAKFDRVFVTSQEDREMLPCPSVVLPNIPYSDSDQGIEPLPPASESKSLLFVGDLQFPPNRDGLDRFLTNIWPLVREQVADAVIRIVGRGLSDADRARWSAIAGADVIGFAPDLVDCYRQCAFTVVPIYFGGGTKIKIAESLAFGRTVVTTSHAMRGYRHLAEDLPALAVADSDRDFADACVRLLQSPALRDAMADRGQKLVERDFSFAGFARVVDEAVNGVLA